MYNNYCFYNNDIFFMFLNSLLLVLGMSYLFLRMYILLFVCLHVICIISLYRRSYGTCRLATPELNMSPSRNIV